MWEQLPENEKDREEEAIFLRIYVQDLSQRDFIFVQNFMYSLKISADGK